MTTPVTLYGTQSNGETLPVQVNQSGQLVAEGLQGPKGEDGAQGEKGDTGEPGGSFPLPPDPYEGAVLGWLDGGLAWLGSPPIVIPEGVFGPITDWIPESGVLNVSGEVPAAVANGVYLYQCNQDGTYFTSGFDTSMIWSDSVSGPEVGWSGSYPLTNGFDGSPDTLANANAAGGAATIALDQGSGLFTVKILFANDQLSSGTTIDGVYCTSTEQANTLGVWSNITSCNELVMDATGLANNARVCFHYISINDQVLVDTDRSIQFRVQQVLGNTLTGSPVGNGSFTPGKYLYVPQQRVAAWVLNGDAFFTGKL